MVERHGYLLVDEAPLPRYDEVLRDRRRTPRPRSAKPTPATAHPDPQLPAADTTFGACRGLVAWLMSILTATAADLLAGAVMTVVPRHGLIGAVGWPTCAWTGPDGWSHLAGARPTVSLIPCAYRRD